MLIIPGDLEQDGHHEVHALAVADCRVALHERVEHIPQRDDVDLDLLRRRLRVSAPQIQLNLTEARIRVLHILVTQYVVVVLIVTHAHRVRGT